MPMKLRAKLTDGQPQLVGGVRGVLERNTLRYYLAIDAWLAARAQSAIFKAIGRTPPIEPAAADQAKYFWYFDGAKARQELGFSPREASATIFDTIEYVREFHLGNGALKGKS